MVLFFLILFYNAHKCTNFIMLWIYSFYKIRLVQVSTYYITCSTYLYCIKFLWYSTGSLNSDFIYILQYLNIAWIIFGLEDIISYTYHSTKLEIIEKYAPEITDIECWVSIDIYLKLPTYIVVLELQLCLHLWSYGVNQFSSNQNTSQIWNLGRQEHIEQDCISTNC